MKAELKIPKGYRRVTQGYIKKGDLALDVEPWPLRWVNTSAIYSDFGFKYDLVMDYLSVIRKIKDK
jgi:hypothetical protein